MKLNSEKCIFEIRADKFLGYIVSERGIEVDPDKIKTIQDMKAPKCINDVQKHNAQVTALGRFTSCSAKRCLPFFKTLKGKNKFVWEEDYIEAFHNLKHFFVIPTFAKLTH